MDAAMIRDLVDPSGEAATPSMHEVRAVWRAALATPRIAVSAEDMRAIGRLRYDTFIARDGKGYAADHARNQFFEPVDSVSLHIGSFLGAECACALRMTRAAQAVPDDRLRRVLEMTRLDREDPQQVLLCSRLALRGDMRSRIHLLEMFRLACRIALLDGLCRVGACARQEVTPLFEKLGFLRVGDPYAEPGAGGLQPMALDLRDTEHLVAVRSPLVRVVRGFKEGP